MSLENKHALTSTQGSTVAGDSALLTTSSRQDCTAGTVDQSSVVATIGRPSGNHSDAEKAPTAAAQKVVEEVSARLAAAIELNRHLYTEVESARHLLTAAQARREKLTERVEKARRELEAVDAQRTKLDAELSALNVSQHDARLAEIDTETKRLLIEEHNLDAQIQETLAVRVKRLEEKHELENTIFQIRLSLEQLFLSQKRELSQIDEKVVDECEEMELVVAGQRHEMSILQGIVDALKRQSEPKLHHDDRADPFLPNSFNEESRSISLPSAETIIPVPSGMLRRITTVQGSGLHRLREKYFVDAWIVRIGECEMGLRVVGHPTGVERFVEDVQQKLRE